MCYLSDPETRPQLAYVQFPQIFRGINKSDIYNAEFKRLYQVIVMGFDGLSGLIILELEVSFDDELYTQVHQASHHQRFLN
jgi:hypothetical protein